MVFLPMQATTITITLIPTIIVNLQAIALNQAFIFLLIFIQLRVIIVTNFQLIK